MRMRPLWIAVPACAAAGVISVSALSAQESGKPGLRTPPDTRAAQSMFGPPPTGKAAEAQQPSLFFPNAAPPRTADGAIPSPAIPTAPAPTTVPPGMRPPRVVIESSPAETSLPVKAPAPAMPILSAPEPTPIRFTAPPAAPAPALAGPQSLVPSAPAAMPPLNTQPISASATPASGAPTSAKQSPSVTIECLAPESVGVGQNCEYILIVKNVGTSAVANVRIEDELPAGAKIVASEPQSESNGTRLAWSYGLVEAGAEKRIKVTVKPGDEGELKSRAMVSFSAVAESRVKVTRPKIAVALTGTDSVRVGDEVPFQIRITNTGSGPASNVLVKAKLSDGMHHPAGTQIEATIDRLPPGESKMITLRALAVKAGQNGCSISAGGEGIATEAATSSVSVVEPMLTAKVAGPARCNVRSEPEYRVELANPGTAPTEPVQAWAVVPDGFEFVSASDGGSWQAANRTITWSLPALAASSNRSLTVKLKAATASEGSLKLMAQSGAAESGVVTASGKAGSGRMLEVKAEAALKAEGVPALRFEVVDVEDPVEVGKEALYDIRVSNSGTGACTNVVVTATLAEGTATAGATGPTTARGQGQQITFDAMPSLAAKGEAVYRVRVRGLQAGDMKLRVQVGCDEMRAPIAKEENTRFVKD